MRIGDILEDRFELLEKLGEGGMGQVFLARDSVLERNVAIKTLLESLLDDRRAAFQLKREVLNAQELRHKGICTIHDYRQAGRMPYIIMEYVEGESLNNYIFDQPENRCNEKTFRRLAAQILDAVEHAHEQGVVHRDLKPGNIIIRPDGRTCIMDFGIAANIKETYALSTGSSVTLSMHYSSPEQIRGSNASPGMDIYALGCVFYHMLKGEPPFVRGDILYQQLNEEPALIEGVSEKLNRAVLLLLRKNPEERPTDIKEVIRIFKGQAETRAAHHALDPGVIEQLTADAVPKISDVDLTQPVRVSSSSDETVRISRGVASSGKSEEGQFTPGEEWVSETGISFVWIPPGEFLMGSPKTERRWFSDELQHRVKLTRGYWLGKYPVTQREWSMIMGSNPSQYSSCGSNCPVERVSWKDAQDFVQKLNQKDTNSSYRLPTEAEWEYAARAGSTTFYCFGDDASRLGEYAWYAENSGGRTHPVGEKKANAWGLYDMHGNVWEWCADWYGDYPSGSVTDPKGPSSGSGRVGRGGRWSADAWDCRSEYRGSGGPGGRNCLLGFRLLRTLRGN